MFNVTIIKMKNIKKSLFALIIIAISIFGVKRFFIDSKNTSNEKSTNEKTTRFLSSQIISSINNNFPAISQINEKEANTEEGLADENNEDADEEFMTESYKKFISKELGIIDSLMNESTAENGIKMAASEEEMDEGQKENTSNTEEKKQEESKAEENVTLAKTDVSTEVVTQNPLKEKTTNNYNGVKIKNESKHELTNEILNPGGLQIDKKNVIIFHTHTCESYTSSEQYSYIPTGNFRTTDRDYSVVRVGNELEKNLKEYGINVVHDSTYHDYPAYTGSYTRSLSTVTNLLKSTKSDIIIDLHRDAIGSYSSYAPTVKIGDEMCAQLMFVMGTNGGGLTHPNWQTNLKWAVSIQEKANQIYPGLFKTMIVRNSRYNQHLGKAACIIEVGATGNTLEQCINSMKYLAKIIGES